MAYIGPAALRTELVKKLVGAEAAQDQKLSKRVTKLLVDRTTINELDSLTRLKGSLSSFLCFDFLNYLSHAYSFAV
jgi:hypothetical protein